MFEQAPAATMVPPNVPRSMPDTVDAGNAIIIVPARERGNDELLRQIKSDELLTTVEI